MNSNKKCVLIIDTKSREVLSELNQGERFDLLGEEIYIKVLNHEGDFFLEVLESYSHKVSLNGKRVIEAAEGNSGDLVEFESSEYVVVAKNLSGCLGNFVNESNQNEIKSIELDHATGGSKKYLWTILFILSFCILQFVLYLNPEKAHKMYLTDDLIMSDELQKEVDTGIFSHYKVIRVDDTTELVLDEDEDEEERLESSNKIESVSKKTILNSKKRKKEVVNLSRYKNKTSYLNNGNNKVFRDFSLELSKSRRQVKLIKSKYSYLINAWNKNIYTVLSVKSKEDKDFKQYLLYAYQGYSFLSNDNKKIYNNFFSKVESVISKYMVTSNLYPNKTINKLKSLKKIIPPGHPLLKEIDLNILSID